MNGSWRRLHCEAVRADEIHGQADGRSFEAAPRSLLTGFTRVSGLMRFCVDYVRAMVYSLLIPPHVTESWEDA